MIRSNLLSNNQKLLNLSAINMNGSNLLIDTSVNFRNNLFYINSNNRIGILKNNPQYTLDILGDINFTGNIYNNGSIVTTEQAVYSLWSNNTGYIFYNGGGVCIGTTSNPFPYSLYVNGTSYFLNQVEFNDNLIINGNITCENITVSGTTTTANFTGTGTTIVDGLTSTSEIDTTGLNITSGDLNITSGNIIGLNSDITCKNIYITGQSSFSSNIIFENNVSIQGILLCLNNINVNNKFLINSSSGNVITSGSIAAGNSLSILGTLNVGGFSELSKVKINNDLDINGNLYVNTGSTELSNLTVENLTNLNSDLNVDNGNFYVSIGSKKVTINYTTTSTNPTSGSLVVVGGVGIGENLFVAGLINSKSGKSEFIDVEINNDLIVNGSSEFNSPIKIYGETTIYEDLICASPGGTITAISGLNVGNTSGNASLTVDSSGNLNTYGNCSIDEDLDIGGNVTIQGNLNLAGSVGTFSGGIITNCRFIEDASSSYDIFTTYSGSTFIIVDHSTLSTINLPDVATIGTFYKIIIGPGYNSSLGTTVTISVTSSSPLINFFGLIDNAGTYTSIETETIISLNSNAPGDFIEISGVTINSSGTFGYYINAKSSQINGFTYS